MPVADLYPCLDSLFADVPAEEALQRIAALGFSRFEFWDWRRRDADALARQAWTLGPPAAIFSGNTFDEPLVDPDAHGRSLAVEPLNSRIDHRGYFLDALRDADRLIEEVGHPAVRLLLDIYVHVADLPGRREPGTGAIPWASVMRRLQEAGYQGAIGLECWPTTSPEPALRHSLEVLAAA